MIKFLPLLCLLALPVFAAEAPNIDTANAVVAPAKQPEQSPEQKAISVLVQQRNAISNNLLDFQAQLMLAQQELESLRKELAELKAKLTDADKTKFGSVAKTP